MDVFQNLASWLRGHNVPNVVSVKTGRAAALRIEVPKMPLTADFDKIDPADIKKAFDAIQALVDFADMVADAHGVSEIKKSTGK